MEISSKVKKQIDNTEPKVKARTLMSPLRYPGSKRRLVDYIKESIKINNFQPSLYVEPFVGGGSVAINLLNGYLVDKVVLADIDPWIVSFWRTVFFDSAWLIKQIRKIEVSLDQWNSLKNSNPSSVREQAITCLFLNRTSFSGILERRAGPLGGMKQESNYPIDCRFTQTTRKTIIERINQISQHRGRIHGIWNCSWDETMQRIRAEQNNNSLPNNDLFYYLDPPFFEEADALYRFYFADEDHKALRDYLLKLEGKWLLSYDSAEQVEVLYGDAIEKGTNGTQHHNIELIYTIASVSKRKKGKEIILSNLDYLPESQPSRSNQTHGEINDGESNCK